MRHIASNKIVSISADSENPNYPATRMLDSHPKRPWKADDGVYEATITADIVGGCSDIMVAGTNAAQASVVITDPNATKWSRDSWGLEGNLSAALNAIVATTANIVDVFVYNTRNDSDGGRWVESAITQSWYTEALNTATRGSKREFPKVALIVAETTKVTIYDATETGCPMWMVFTWAVTYNLLGYGNRAATSISMLNGVLVKGASESSDGLFVANFLTDAGYRYTAVAKYLTSTSIAQRINTPAYTSISAVQAIVNAAVNDVAMTQISRTENAFGLLDPVIAVATDGGVSVVDGPAGVGTVVDQVYGTNAISKIHFEGSRLLWQSTAAVVNFFADISHYTVDYSSSSFSAHVANYSGAGYFSTSIPATITHTTNTFKAIAADSIAGNNGLTKLSEDTATPANGMVAYITNSYNTGWLKGDIRRSLICEAEGTTETLTNLVTNGTFDSDTGWAKQTGWTISSGTANKAAGTQSNINQSNVFTVGKKYAVTYTVLNVSAGSVRLEAAGYTGTYRPANGTYTEIVSGQTTTVLYFTADAAFAGAIDNVIVTEAILDRSVKASSMVVNGSLTRSPVAAGAELQAISEFSTSNFLSQAYSADLDFGTGDFYAHGWLKENPNSAEETVFERAYWNGSAYTGSAIKLFVLSSGELRFFISNDGYVSADAVISPSAIDTSSLLHFVVQKVGSVIQMYLNMVKVTPDTTITNAPSSLSNALATLAVGARTSIARPLTNGSVTLLKIGAGSLSADQIAKIYREELALFQPGAKCTIQGASSAVTALAFDEGKQLLHVGTSAGVTSFMGLSVATTTYDDGLTVSSDIKALSAFRGLFLAGTAAQAYAWLPPSYSTQTAEFAGGDFSTITSSVIQRSQSGSIWIRLSETVSIPCEVTITMSGPGGESLYAGVLMAGISSTYGDRNPLYGLGQTSIDYSIFEETSNGSFYYKKRDIVRSFDVSAILLRDEALNLQYSFEDIGMSPSAWMLVDGFGNDFVLYGRFQSPPTISHSYHRDSEVNFNIIEVI